MGKMEFFLPLLSCYLPPLASDVQNNNLLLCHFHVLDVAVSSPHLISCRALEIWALLHAYTISHFCCLNIFVHDTCGIVPDHIYHQF